MEHRMKRYEPNSLSRRGFLQHSVAGAGLWAANQPLAVLGGHGLGEAQRPKVAAIFTEFRFRSHAYNILENFMGPYLFNGTVTDPGVDIVSFYADQFPADDMTRKVSERTGIVLCDTIEQAVCLDGKDVAVDAVLLIGEHGKYPRNRLGQVMYPRKLFFDAVVAPMKRSGKFVPVFNDKHLSYRWDWAKEMYDTAGELGIPFMAGSSVPLAQRTPDLELPQDAQIEEAVSIHGGGFESYDFHSLEVLQSIVESRRGGEAGVTCVEFLQGEKLDQALQAGRISQSLVDAAMKAERDADIERQPFPDPANPQPEKIPPRKKEDFGQLENKHAILLTYRDGFRATVMAVGSSSNRWNFACRLKGETAPRATAFINGPWGNRCLFKALSYAIQYLFRTRRQPYPVERTLLVSGALEAAVHSSDQVCPIETPHLEFGYQPIDFREMRETGASWEVITSETPQPIEFSPGADVEFARQATHS